MKAAVNHIFQTAVALAVCAAATLSCVRLELKTSDDTSDRAKISFSTAWGNASDAVKGDTVFIAMNKVSDEIRYAFEVDAAGNYLPDGGHDSSAVYGNYVILAYWCDRQDYILSGTQNFLSDRTLSIRDFKATVKELPEDELAALRGESRIDFNAAYRYLRTPSPVWAGSLRAEVSDTKENAYSLELQPLQLELKVAVRIEALDGVGISSAVAELSGIPASVSIYSGEVDDADLARVIFPLSRKDGLYEGTVAVPGLFPSSDISLSNGPGILSLIVTATSGGKTKILHPAINISDEISGASLMKKVNGSDGYRTARTKVRIEVGKSLKISQESFSSGSGGDSVAEWFDSESIDVEI